MKVAILHDHITEIGGAQYFILQIAKRFNGTVITTDIDNSIIKKCGFDNIDIRSLGKTTNRPRLRVYESTFKFLTANLKDEYDVYILSGDYGHYAALKNHPNIYYCHSPTRIFYDLKKYVLGRCNTVLQKIDFFLWIELHSRVDRWSMKYVDKMLVNGKNVQNRVKKYYNMESEVVYPPVNTKKYRYKSSEDFWLSVGRIYPEKRVDFQLEIFEKIPDENLVIVGSGPDKPYTKYVLSKIRSMKNVKLVQNISDEELVDLYSRCKGHIATAIDEDFGLTPVEAMASGKPVIAVNEGGYRETIVDNVTGWLLPADVNSFVEKIKSLKNFDFSSIRKQCIAQAKKFDEDIYVENLEKIMTHLVKRS